MFPFTHCQMLSKARKSFQSQMKDEWFWSHGTQCASVALIIPCALQSAQLLLICSRVRVAMSSIISVLQGPVGTLPECHVASVSQRQTFCLILSLKARQTLIPLKPDPTLKVPMSHGFLAVMSEHTAGE